jgi:hypothetical protein
MLNPKPVPLGELEAAVKNAVQQALGKAGAVPIDQLWVGFVAPEKIATQQLANEIASIVGGPGSIGSIGSVGGSVAGAVQTGAHKEAVPNLRILGYIHKPT